MLIYLPEAFLPQKLTDIATVAQGFGSLLILALVYVQIKQTNVIIEKTKEESYNLNIYRRPWIGVQSVEFNKISSREHFLVTYILKNYGQSPASSINIYSEYFNHIPENISNSGDIFLKKLIGKASEMLAPNESMTYVIPIPKSELDNLKKQKSELFVYLCMEYKYFVSGSLRESSFEFIDKILNEESSTRFRIEQSE
jgi:hypothetical protein